MQFGFVRNSPALVSAIERGIPLSSEDFTLAVEHLFIHPERMGPSGTVVERIITSTELHAEHLGPLLFALSGSHVEIQRLQILFEKILNLPLMREYHLICMTTAICSSQLSVQQKIRLFEKVVTHPSKTSLVLMGRTFAYELNSNRSWIGLGVIEALALLSGQPPNVIDIIRKITDTPAASIQCQRSLVHALEVIPLNREQKHLLLMRILHWPSLCQTVHRRVVYLLRDI